MRLSVLAVSNEATQHGYIRNLETFSGKMAGICYMKDSYFDSYVSDDEKARSRFDRVIRTGHHSISDHSFITILFEDIPKMTAMILNSLGFYNTSEKSGRYTIMYSTGKNKELYDKWYQIFYDRILEYDSNIDKTNTGEASDLLRRKLAQENARYMLSVFEPSVTMAYTTSLRMWSYIVCMCRDYLDTADHSTEFNKKIYNCIYNLYLQLLLTNCFSDRIIDNKSRKFNFLSNQTGYNIDKTEESVGVSYLIKYKTSFASLAQEQRHRTLEYFMCFDGSDTTKISFYVPRLLQTEANKKLSDEWLDDLSLITETYPNAILVNTVEIGNISDFMLKCDERLCGRVMLETMENVRNNLYKFVRAPIKSEFMTKEIERHFRDGKVVMKCGNTVCKEPCYWGPIKSQNKLI